MPPSKAATTARPSIGANPNKSALHSVRIGLPLPPRQTVLATRFSQIQGPDAPTPFEKSGLEANMDYGIAGIDHLIVGVRDLEQARLGWRRLGFTLSPRGRHI